MNSNERGMFERGPSYGLERPEGGGAEQEQAREKGVDLRNENELFLDHERIDGSDNDAELSQLRDSLTEDVEGVLRLNIPEYNYDFTTNPFVGMGPRVRRTYAISRYLDVVFLHRYMFQDILVCGLRSRMFVDEQGRSAFVRHLRGTGGTPVRANVADSYDFLALICSPYVASDTTAAWFTFYHKQEPLSVERPHYPVDVWVIYDAHAYEEVPGVGDFRKAYRLKLGYSRQTSVLGIAQIN